ncbi:MAG TPA: hypothetical protein H9735_09110 [Candidatus Anaerostipes excrementavium]|uniref:Uncharacterized protein n=1 Tax=Candidatus Anaerostipes excrementavium TaxID=2838463 RepID=A0A9D1WWD8_9FIRM|nr:hypothetical protein [uncultured Anaerostipes sp.]HIX68256.1 hypothetical protein [Candidatus Anaerostipes excrementavium]
MDCKDRLVKNEKYTVKDAAGDRFLLRHLFGIMRGHIIADNIPVKKLVIIV